MKPRINYTGSSTLMAGGVERLAPQRRALPFSGLSNRKPLKVGQRVMELPVETYCGGQAQGRFVRRPESEPSHPQAAFVFLTLFFFHMYPSQHLSLPENQDSSVVSTFDLHSLAFCCLLPETRNLSES